MYPNMNCCIKDSPFGVPLRKTFKNQNSIFQEGFRKNCFLCGVPSNFQILPLAWSGLFSFNIVVALCMNNVPLL